MVKMNKGISIFVIILIIVGITTSLVAVQGLTNFQGTIETPSGTPINGASVVLYDSLLCLLGADTTGSNGQYSITVTLSGYSPYYLYVLRDRFDTEIEQVTSGGTYDIELTGDAYKLAYLFYANDASDQDVIEEYEEILEEEEGYTVEIIADCDDVEGKCEDIADIESYLDTIFVYIMCHGNYSGGNSYTQFDNMQTQIISSEDFKGYLDDWEAERVFLFVDSCESGGWPEDFAETPYLVISSSDTSHASWRYEHLDHTWEGRFSEAFFDEVYGEYTAVQAFNRAKVDFDESTDPYPSYPQKEDYSSYTWFN